MLTRFEEIAIWSGKQDSNLCPPLANIGECNTPPHIAPQNADAIRQLLSVIVAWPSLSEPLKEAIIAIVKAGVASGKEVEK